jgi:hypothetical protein
MAILRQQIIEALATNFGAITKAHDFNTDSGAHVFEWKSRKWESRDLPGINIEDRKQADDDTFTEDRSLTRHTLSVTIEAACASGHDSPEEIRKITADIEKVLRLDQTLGGLVEEMSSVGNEMGVAQDESIIAGITMEIEIKYLTGTFNEE